MPICGAPLKIFDSANLPRLFHREDRCERRPHHQESLRALAKRHGVNPKTIAKWKARKSVSDLRTGPKEPRSTVLSAEEEAVIVAFRRHALLPLDDCLYALQPTIPHLTRSSLHRGLQRHGISRVLQVEGEASAERIFKAYPIGYFHIDIAEVRTTQGKLSLIVAIDPTSKFAFVEMHEKAARRTAGDFLRRLTAAVPYKVHTVLTDNGTHFTTPGHTSWAAPDIKGALEAGELVWAHAFEYACAQNDIDHRLTKPKPPWTNGQVERMNRTIKDATVKRDFYETHDQLRAHLQNFAAAYNLRENPDPQRPHSVRVRLQSLDLRAAKIRTQSAPANARTKQLVDATNFCSAGRVARGLNSNRSFGTREERKRDMLPELVS